MSSVNYCQITFWKVLELGIESTRPSKRVFLSQTDVLAD